MSQFLITITLSQNGFVQAVLKLFCVCGINYSYVTCLLESVLYDTASSKQVT